MVSSGWSICLEVQGSPKHVQVTQDRSLSPGMDPGVIVRGVTQDPNNYGYMDFNCTPTENVGIMWGASPQPTGIFISVLE